MNPRAIVPGAMRLGPPLAAILLALAVVAPSVLEAQERGYVAPRTEHGQPDLQGNWTNATMTPINRPAGVGPVLTAAQVEALEQGRQDFIAQDIVDSDPDREYEEAMLKAQSFFDSLRAVENDTAAQDDDACKSISTEA